MTLAKAEERLGTKSLLPQGWRWVQLGDICDMNPSRPAGFRRASDAPTTFVPMSAVDEHRGTIFSAEIRPFSEVAKGYTFFSEGDILFAKITPCMQNGKQAIARGLIDGIGFGSTEFHVIRPRPGVVCEWIHRFVRRPHVLRAAANHFTGAVGQQRVPESFLASLEIPLPPIDEQDRVMHIVNEQMTAVEKARAAAEARLQAAKALPMAYLRAVFESEEAKGWPLIHLREVCRQIDYGYTASADFTLREPRFLRITDIQNGNVIWDTVPGCKISQSEEVATRLWDGDIVFARTGGTVGKSFLIKNPPRAVFASYLIRLRPEKDTIEPEYLYAFLQSDGYWRQLRMASRGGAQPNVNATLLGNLELPVPSIKKQQANLLNLREQMGHVTKLTEVIERELETINALPAALLRRAFTGGL